MLPEFKTIRTTLTLPEELVNRTQRFVDDGAAPSRNALIVAALERFIDQLEQREIDRQFEAMAEDEEYLRLSQQVADDFAESDWEALTQGEAE